MPPKAISNPARLARSGLEVFNLDFGAAAALSAIKWQVNVIPSSFLIDKSGNVVAIDPEKQELVNKIRELLGL